MEKETLEQHIEKAKERFINLPPVELPKEVERELYEMMRRYDLPPSMEYYYD